MLIHEHLSNRTSYQTNSVFLLRSKCVRTIMTDYRSSMWHIPCALNILVILMCVWHMHNGSQDIKCTSCMKHLQMRNATIEREKERYRHRQRVRECLACVSFALNFCIHDFQLNSIIFIIFISMAFSMLGVLCRCSAVQFFVPIVYFFCISSFIRERVRVIIVFWLLVCHCFLHIQFIDSRSIW